ncbi:tRNA uridine(34) 5-carboxymethylaminomethyl synthesis GTPase MnmE [Helicobacter enhydrae]|uniref:tRNA modification GTPase MnmE n=1 Tax=Helicobacter enhydrae TaxID=222136 RepID=A0A1B1U4D7_9HELI|nr:tRNA uridine-5-carboxymethylaminomethyl(34) synthesis GTPase MnmE [Helicobacter enhydrae]ANV97623.1 tRNA uridine(34) 5-carboxymethylaminomethyl synthesis GTPase MnmE [Helicobacter enhydrae]
MTSKANSSTIVAISTALGRGAVAVVRLSGPHALEIVCNITRKQKFQPRYATLCHIYDGDELLDEAIVIYFKAPLSYTREEVCEIQCHGGAVIAHRILELTLECGATLARNGEFTQRAFLNGRIDLSQAQAISQMISAKSVQAQKILAKQLRGDLSLFVNESRDKLLEVLAYSEVMIDYADEDLPQDLLSSMQKKILTLQKILEEILETSARRTQIFDGLTLSIIGKPNVGKSSLLNAILACDRAIISNVAGTTRDTIEERVNIGGVELCIVDTAGIRQSQDEIEKIGIERSCAMIAKSEIVLAVFDASKPLDSDDEEILALLQTHKDKEIVLVLNKADLPPKIKPDTLPFLSISLSAKESQIAPLMEHLKGLVQTQDNEGIVLSNASQIQSVKMTLKSLQEAQKELEAGMLEFFSYNLKEAIAHLGHITKPYKTEDLLDKMFGDFCLGK